MDAAGVWNEMNEHKILIVSGGCIDDALVRGLLGGNEYKTVIACDGGTEFFRRNGCVPDLIVGDFDSARAGTIHFFKNKGNVRVEQFPPEKDWTDTELAVRRALEDQPAHIDLVGATGSRIDHLLGNVQLLALALSRGVPMFLWDAHNRIRLLEKACVITREEQYGDYVSLLPFGGTAYGVTLEGMKYPLHGATLTPDITVGISNEIVDEQARISFSQGRLLMIEAKD